MKILVIQTAFLGDVILTIPMIQALRSGIAGADIDVLVTPAGAAVLEGHPLTRTVITYDKKERDRSLGALLRLSTALHKTRYDVVIVPHRSLRSAFLAWRSGARRRIGFDRSSGRFLLTDVVTYDPSAHEVDRNCSLLNPLGIVVRDRLRPSLASSDNDRQVVSAFLTQNKSKTERLIAVAPGSVWNTKRWPEIKYVQLCTMLVESGNVVVLIGGREDAELCERIRKSSASPKVMTSAGMLSVLQSAELIGRARALVTNDSAPLHMGVAAGVPVIAIFGATVPEFGFGPYGPKDIVIQTNGLPCRPCAIHGGQTCPIGTLDCLEKITPASVHAAVLDVARPVR